MSPASDPRPAASSGEPSAWVPLSDERCVEVSGSDAVGFLHRMLTQDVKGIAVGAGRPALLLTPRGRIVGDPFVWRFVDHLLLVLAPRAAEAAIPVLERYVIADDVTFRDVSSAWASGLLLGPVAAPVGALVVSVPFGALLARRVLVEARGAIAFERALREAGVEELEGTPFRARRVAAGVPWFGDELDDRILPNEAGLDGSISFTKGCYVGQEPVIMAKHRGHPPSRLVRLAIDTGETPERDARLLAEGKPVGRVASVVRPGVSLPLRALAFVRWDLGVVGRAFALDDGRAAVVEAALA